MSQNTQNPYFWTLDGSGTNQLEVVGATFISIYNNPSASGVGDDSTQIANSETGQSINLPIGCVMELSPDRGNTLQTLVIIPNGTNTTYVTMFGGTSQLI
tara:strand:+ start:1747 stop:2046 length:300 start_codon:yes stop_codon:yes gene_type:complete